MLFSPEGGTYRYMRNLWPVKPLVLLSILLAFTIHLPAQSAGMSADEAHRKAETLLKQMNLDEKIGQMNQAAGMVIPGLGGAKPDDLIAKGGVGSVLWLIDVKEINRL